MTSSPRRSFLIKPYKLIAGVALEDWHTKGHPALNSRGDLILTPDLNQSGTLFKLWEAYRLAVTNQTVSTLLHYLTVLGGTTTPFEETFALREDKLELEKQ